MFSARARALVVTLLTTAATAATTVIAPAANAALPNLTFGRSIENLAPYQAQRICSPTAKPGTVALRAFVMKAFPGTRDSGIVRACSVGGTSEHKEGRAWDWGVRYSVATERAKAQAFLTWLLKTDSYGNKFSNARRLGVQYVIWNHRIWGSYDAASGWRPYTGADPHTSHVHISLTWPGAKKQTSFWTKGAAYQFPAPPPPPVETGNTGGSTGGSSGGTTTVRYPEPQPLPQPNPIPEGAPLEDETIQLNTTSSGGVASQNVLQAGEFYRITLAGTYRWGGGMADVECSTTNQDPNWRRIRSIVSTHPDWDTLDAYLNGYDIQGRPTIDNGRGCNTTNHTYTWEFRAPTTDKARLKIWDPAVYGDDAGLITAHLVHLGPPTLGDDGDTTGGATGGTTPGYVTSPTSFTVDAASPTGSSTSKWVQAGHSYDITMTGTYNYGGASADAECSQTTGDSRWRRSRDWGITTGDTDLLDLKLGTGVDPVSTTAGGTDCDWQNHTYTWRWTPDHDQLLKAFVYDTNYSDNSGELTVNVTPV